MKVITEFNRTFSLDNLNNLYQQHIATSYATGIDNMNHQVFREMKDEQISIIERKVLEGSYSFTKYKLKLISKGRGKSPREISIPTIRDRLALRALCDFLQIRFKDDINFDLPQNVIRDVKTDMSTGQFDAFIKLDLSNFYPSINHQLLLQRLRRRIRDKVILNVIESSITAPTVPKPHASDRLNEKGVPQGLSTSNVLAAIFLSNLDKRYNTRTDIAYYRYVDDILILCKKNDCELIAEDVIAQFKRLRLKVHDPIKAPDKSSIGVISDESFTYLGYHFEEQFISARSGSVDKLRESILSIFSGYKHSKLKSQEFLEWRLNLRITGCIFNKKSKGWLFFFSEITDKKLLHELDSFIMMLCKRFEVDIKPRKFTKAFYQVKHKKYDSKYIQNFDLYNHNEMAEILIKYFNKSTEGMSNEDVEIAFKKRVAKQVKELETDLLDFGYKV
ncbi:RNA-dependent DNA polymerase [Vibrio tasmaniensis 1F-187]|uniref:RNA-dependent DNA polymerase n=1 Tax=Vibrio tasmaniensis TaxID=212663 RepID=UPI0003009271|nr:RNA-dependent DNA polymerase [Vibrio tasmaniensis]OEF67214.1 RNA-dependent DNA polymerase [Vibrio tasmaniensis 1F-187]